MERERGENERWGVAKEAAMEMCVAETGKAAGNLEVVEWTLMSVTRPPDGLNSVRYDLHTSLLLLGESTKWSNR